jgi:integrase/recombinase XerC
VVRAYIAHVANKGVEKATVQRKLAAVKSFIRWLTDEGLFPEAMEHKIVGRFGVAGPKLPVKIPPIPSEQEMAVLLDGEFPTAFPERDRLLLELLYSDGLRVAEASGLKVQDIRAEQGALLIHGKGNKTRLAPIGAHLHKALGLTYLSGTLSSIVEHVRGSYALRVTCKAGLPPSWELINQPLADGFAAPLDRKAMPCSLG